MEYREKCATSESYPETARLCSPVSFFPSQELILGLKEESNTPGMAELKGGRNLGHYSLHGEELSQSSAFYMREK